MSLIFVGLCTGFVCLKSHCVLYYLWYMINMTMHNVNSNSIYILTTCSCCLDFARLHCTRTVVELCISFIYGDMYCSNSHHSVELRNLKTSTSASHCLDFAHVHYTVTIVGLCIGFVYRICTVVTYTTAWGFKTQRWPLASHWYTLFGFCSCALYHSYCGIVCRFCLRDFLGGGDSSVVRVPDS